MAFVSSTFTPRLQLGATCSPLVVPRRARPSPCYHHATRVVKAVPHMSTESPTTADQQPSANETVREVVLDENIVGFCTIDPKTGKRDSLSLREKESLFLDAMQAYFKDGKSILSNDEFDTLKEDLTWEGSDVVSLSRDEFRFLDAAKAYEQGQPVMPDDEFDALKKQLESQGSIVTIQRGPRCSVQRRITFSNVVPDRRRTFVLYVPAGLVSSLLWLSFAYELTPLHQIDPVLSLILGSPIIFFAARILTGLIVPDPLIVVGDCPNCGRRTHVLFGNVLTLEGYSKEANIKCDKCKSQLKVERDTNRMILMKEGGR